MLRMHPAKGSSADPRKATLLRDRRPRNPSSRQSREISQHNNTCTRIQRRLHFEVGQSKAGRLPEQLTSKSPRRAGFLPLFAIRNKAYSHRAWPNPQPWSVAPGQELALCRSLAWPRAREANDAEMQTELEGLKKNSHDIISKLLGLLLVTCNDQPGAF